MEYSHCRAQITGMDHEGSRLTAMSVPGRGLTPHSLAARQGVGSVSAPRDEDTRHARRGRRLAAGTPLKARLGRKGRQLEFVRPTGLVLGVEGIRLRRDNWVSVRYAEELNSGKSSVTPQRTDRHGILGEKLTDFHVSL